MNANLQIVDPTDAKPDLSTLRLIKESELRRGSEIGSGAFGTVYKVSSPSPISRNWSKALDICITTEFTNLSLAEGRQT